MRFTKTVLRVCLAWLTLMAANVALSAPPQADPITKEEVRPLLGRADVVVIDLRFGHEWTEATLKIKGAIREDPMKPGQWMDKYPKDKTIILYCAGPDDGSAASLARVFKLKGFTSAYYLKGGWAEWIGAKYPTEPKGHEFMADQLTGGFVN